MSVAVPCQPHDHLVQFYESETFLADRVADYLRAGAAAGEQLLVLLTPPHLAAVLQRLETAGLDTHAAMASGQFVAHDAHALLGAIMRNGMPVEALFEHHLLADIRAAGATPTRAFGELVNLLCAEGNPEAAVQLEAFWHAACHRLPLTLLCSYDMQHFCQPGDRGAFDAICDHHSHVLPADGFSLLEPHQQMREVSRLQQQVQSLHREMALREQAERTLSGVETLCSEMLMELADHALHDRLTGLRNRQHAQRTLAELIDRSSEAAGKVAVLHIGIDNLQAINDALGLEVGDYCLYQTAQRIKCCLGPYPAVSRLGGDEMLVVLSDFKHEDEVLPVVERLLDWTRQPVQLTGQKVFVNCCIGISFFPDHGRTVAELMRHAGLAGRHAKRLGRHRPHVFSPDLVGDGPDRIALSIALRDALSRGELELFYLPLICARSGQVMAISAEPRWNSSQFGVMGSARWMSAVAEAGQAAPICHWVLTDVCRHAQAWLEAGVGLRVTVQVSSADLLGSELVDWIEEALADTGLPSEMLEIGLTQSALMRAPDCAEAILKRLKARGVRLAVDDYGSGHSILEHLSRFPVDAIKINASFIEGCLDNPHHQAIIHSVVVMAHQLGLEVTAKGVSTRQQADYLRQQGCDILQGSLWSRMEYRGPSNKG